MARQQTGDPEANKSKPVEFEWQWYHYIPGVFFWVFAAILIGAIVKAKDNRPAQLILAAILLTAIVLQVI